MLTRGSGLRPPKLLLACLLLALALGACGMPALGGGGGATPAPTATVVPTATPTAAPAATVMTAPTAVATAPPAPSPTAAGTVAPPPATTGAAPTPPAARRATPGPDAGVVGQRLERDGIAFTVRQASGVKQFGSHPPREGYFYLVLDVLVENVGLESWRHQLHFFDLDDDRGGTYTIDIFAPSPSLPIGETLTRGASVRGNIAFEIAPTAGSLFVSYRPEVAPGRYIALEVKLDEAGAYAPAPTASAGSPRPAGTPAATPPARPSPTTAARRTPSAAPSTGAVDDWGPALAPLDGGQTYDDPRGRFAFRVPEEWTETDTAQNEVAFVLRRSQAVAGVGLEDTGEPTIGIERVRQAFDRELRGRPDYTQVSIDRVLVDGRRAYRQVLQRTDADGTQQLVQVYLVERGVVHILSFACPVDAFAEWAPVFDGIAGSYRVGR